MVLQRRCGKIVVMKGWPSWTKGLRQRRSFAVSACHKTNTISAPELNENITQEEKDHFAKRLAEDKQKQMRRPWHREGSDKPPVAHPRSAGAVTKGKLLTTPSRMLKIVLPLTTKDTNPDRKDMEPLALLVHPQQPISYLERLIQAELPTFKDKEGRERIPSVFFHAEDSTQSATQSARSMQAIHHEPDFEKVDELRIGGKIQRTGKLHGSASGSSGDKSRLDEARDLPDSRGTRVVESYSGQAQDASPKQDGDRKFVRWSSSTELGDFIRDAARGREFAIEIEAAPEQIYVEVPTFAERTFYLRMRLRKTSKRISEMADIKQECDDLAHKAAKNVARAGFAGIVSWWGVVYYLTFQTELGWDVMEPVTYLVGLSTLIGGYVWFLYHNREVSYRSAMNFTISRRQHKLYQQHRFDLRKWEMLIDDGNALRREIKAVATEYDVEWDELEEEKDEKVAEALKMERRKKKEKSQEGEEEDEDEDEDEDGDQTSNDQDEAKSGKTG